MSFYNPQLYTHAREDCAALDLTSTRARLLITGEDRFSWLQGMVSNDVEVLKRDQQQSLPAFVLDPTGHPLADINIISFNSMNDFSPNGSPCIILDLPVETENRVTTLLENYIIMEDVTIYSVSQKYAHFSLIGPTSHTIDLSAYVTFPNDERNTATDCLLAMNNVQQFQNLILELQIPLLDSITAELLRIEDGIPKWGNEISQNVLAPEVDYRNMRSSISKGCYVGQEIITRIASRGHTNRQLTGLVFEKALPPKYESVLYDDDKREVGWVTSTTPCSPLMNDQTIGIGFIRHEIVSTNSSIHIAESNVKLHPLPFYKS